MRIPTIATVALALLFGGALLIAAAAEGGKAPSAPAAPAPPRPPAPPGVGDPVRAFAAPDLNGEPVDVPALIKGKVSVVTFWASWCEPCLNEIDRFKEIFTKYRHDGLVVIGVGMQEGGDTVAKQRQMAARRFMSYTLVFDQDREFEKAYVLSGVPLNLLVGADGKIRYRDAKLPDDLESRVQALLKEAAGGSAGGGASGR